MHNMHFFWQRICSVLWCNEICKIYAQYAAKKLQKLCQTWNHNMQKLCKKYARNMQNICRIYGQLEYAKKMQKNAKYAKICRGPKTNMLHMEHVKLAKVCKRMQNMQFMQIMSPLAICKIWTEDFAESSLSGNPAAARGLDQAVSSHTARAPGPGLSESHVGRAAGMPVVATTSHCDGHSQSDSQAEAQSAKCWRGPPEPGRARRSPARPLGEGRRHAVTRSGSPAESVALRSQDRSWRRHDSAESFPACFAESSICPCNQLFLDEKKL